MKKFVLLILILTAYMGSYAHVSLPDEYPKISTHEKFTCPVDTFDISMELYITKTTIGSPGGRNHHPGKSQGLYNLCNRQLSYSGIDHVRLLRTGIYPGDPHIKIWQYSKRTEITHTKIPTQSTRSGTKCPIDGIVQRGQRKYLFDLEGKRIFYNQGGISTSENNQTAMEQMAKIPIVVGKDLLNSHHPVYRC